MVITGKPLWLDGAILPPTGEGIEARYEIA
jgi:hypothetical protein